MIGCLAKKIIGLRDEPEKSEGGMPDVYLPLLYRDRGRRREYDETDAPRQCHRSTKQMCGSDCLLPLCTLTEDELKFCAGWYYPEKDKVKEIKRALEHHKQQPKD